MGSKNIVDDSRASDGWLEICQWIIRFLEGRVSLMVQKYKKNQDIDYDDIKLTGASLEKQSTLRKVEFDAVSLYQDVRDNRT